MKVRWWQLGGDRDTSFVGYPDLEAKLREIQADFSRFGQELHLGLPWRFLDENPVVERPPWSFLSHTADPPLTAEELRSYLAAPSDPGVRRWVQLEPLSQRAYSRRVQARDLILRMLAAKTAGAQGIFLTDPFDEDRGLMNADGSPGPLLLPWCTTAQLISGTEYLGSLQLPHGSRNAVFVRGRRGRAGLVERRSLARTGPTGGESAAG